jgi:protease-4
MKRGKYILIIFLIFFFLILITIISFVYYEFGRPPAVKAHSYLEIFLSGEIIERATPDFFMTLFLGRQPLTIHDLRMNIRKAKVDRRIDSLLVRLGYLECSWGKISELREAILDFRKSGKKAYAYIEEIPEPDKEYFLATACDKIILHPIGNLNINGIGGYHPYLKKGLAKLGIEAEAEHVEEYKTAFNMFTEEGFTKAEKEMLESIYGDIFSQYVKAVSQTRGKSEEEVKNLLDHGFFYGEEALKAGLVDGLLYLDEIEELLKGKKEKINKISLSQYSKIKPTSLGLNRGKRIALIYGMGPIYTGTSYYQTIGSQTLARWIKKARENKSIEAVVFRVDSPGGSAVGSDVIWKEVVLTKKEKPFIVSMSDVAGSGGYWISMGAHKIVAHPQTLTGSIGVIFGKFNLAGFYKKLGITHEKLTYGEKADIYSSFRSLTPEERTLIKKEILWIYDQFLIKVADGRDMTKEEVDKIGKGRVWTGNQAKDLGLVDEIGGLSKAIELAKELAGIPAEEEVRLVVWPKKVSFFQAFFGRMGAKSDLIASPNLENTISNLKLLEKNNVWALMPPGIEPE